MLHFVTSYMKLNKSRKQTLESAQYGLEISFKHSSKRGVSFIYLFQQTNSANSEISLQQ